MDQEERLLWLNGELTKARDAKINVLSPTAQFGGNIFEGIRCYWNERQGRLYAFRLDDHYKRLRRSAELFKIDVPYSDEDLKNALRMVVAANRYETDIAVRQTIFLDGFGSWFSQEPVGMFIAPIEKARREMPLDKTVTCMVSTWERIHEGILSPKAKVGANYINSRFALLEARENGFDTALFLNREGTVSEGPGSCFFLVKDGKLVTPSLDSSILESITRDTLIHIARKDMGIEVEERRVKKEELYACHEAFFCGSAVEVEPVSKIDHYVVGEKPGPITRELHQKYLEIVTGKNGGYRHWLTAVI